MRIIHCLEVRVVPARISPRFIEPLVNLPFSLEQKVVFVRICRVLRARVVGHATVSIIVITEMGLE